MILTKTLAGQEELKDRHGALTSRQRSAFILFDGKRTLVQVLEATAAMGITVEDVQAMIDQGLLTAPLGSPPIPVGGLPTEAASPAVAADGGEAAARSPMQRYQAAYPIATELTASLGLRGFRLNLSVEAATSYDDLAALAPKIREAVGDAKYARLGQALFR